MKVTQLPRALLVEQGALRELPTVLTQVSDSARVLLVADVNTMKIAGTQLRKNLEKNGYTVTSSLIDGATEDAVNTAQKQIQKNNIGITIGLGGGTCIDVAKLSGARENIPFVSVPTIASHDGVCSAVASIRSPSGFKSYPAVSPIAVVADTTVIAAAPPRFLSAGCSDLLSNYTAVEDWRLAQKEKGESYNHYAAGLAILAAEPVFENASTLLRDRLNATKVVMEGLIVSGLAMSIQGSSQPCSGMEHLFSHALDRVAPKPALHGEQVGVGTIMAAKLHGMDWEKFRDALKSLNAPTTASELGIEEKYILEALTIAHTVRDRFTILRTGLSLKEAKALATSTEVL